MKKIGYLFSFILLFFVSVSFVDAASFKISSNKSTVVVGNTVTVTVAVSGSDAAGWEYCLNYDTSVFTLSSANSDTGGKCVKTGSTLTGFKTVNFKLKAKKSGSSKFTLSGAAIYNDDLKLISSSYNAITVKAKTQAEIEASYSTNANLISLKVDGYDLTPEFSKDTLKYSLEVENEIEKITIRAGKADSSASVSGTGEKTLTEGINQFNIVVTAEKGNKKTYVIEVNRKELNPIHVNVNNEQLTVVRKSEVLEAPTYYSGTEIEIEGEMVPALKSEITGYTLVGLKDEIGNINLYSIGEIDNTYKLYKQIGLEGMQVIPLDSSETAKDRYTTKKEIMINNTSVSAFIDSSDDTYAVLYAMNASTGKTNWYKYDTLEGTFQRYEEPKKVVDEKENKDLYFLLSIIFIGVSAFSIIIIFILLGMNSSAKKKNHKLIAILEGMRAKALIKEEPKEDKEVIVVPSVEEVVDKPLSKRELRRLEKEQAKALESKEETPLEETMLEQENESAELEEDNTSKKKNKKRK